VPKKSNDLLRSELLSIVGVEYLGVTNGSEYLLELVGNQTRTLPWQGTQVNESGGMILQCHHPAHENTKGITFPQLLEVNEVNLKAVTKLP
jgi:hypothetical protein